MDGGASRGVRVRGILGAATAVAFIVVTAMVLEHFADPAGPVPAGRLGQPPADIRVPFVTTLGDNGIRVGITVRYPQDREIVGDALFLGAETYRGDNGPYPSPAPAGRDVRIGYTVQPDCPEPATADLGDVSIRIDTLIGGVPVAASTYRPADAANLSDAYARWCD